jgi:hypothetical protein
MKQRKEEMVDMVVLGHQEVPCSSILGFALKIPLPLEDKLQCEIPKEQAKKLIQFKTREVTNLLMEGNPCQLFAFILLKIHQEEERPKEVIPIRLTICHKI